MNCASVIRIPTANGILTHSANELRSTSGQAVGTEDVINLVPTKGCYIILYQKSTHKTTKAVWLLHHTAFVVLCYKQGLST